MSDKCELSVIVGRKRNNNTAMELLPNAAAALRTEALKRHLERGDDLASYARSDRTQQAYESDVRQWLDYAKRHGIPPYPISPSALVAYLGYMDERDYKVATVKRRLAGLVQWHQSRGDALPMGPKLKERLKGLRRKKGVAQTAKRAFTLEQIAEMLLLMGDSDVECRDKAMLLVGFQSSARRSELAELTWEDVEEHQTFWLLHIRRSKTDQEGLGQDVVLPQEGGFSALAALRDWRERQGTGTGPVFGITDRTIARRAQHCAKMIGLDPGVYGAHSLRSGFATEADRKGASVREIQGQTHHKDARMVDRYIQKRAQAENKAARLVAEGLSELTPKKPRGYEVDLGDYRVLLVDSSSGEPVAWGFPLLKSLGEERFSALGQLGELACLDHVNGGKYGFVVRRLNHAEAIRKYGEVTGRETGPRGGWRSITYGKTQFLSKLDGDQ